MKNVNEMTQKELMALPEREWNAITVYDAIILVPQRHLHDSGFSRIAIIGSNDDKAIEIAAYQDLIKKHKLGVAYLQLK